MICSGLDLREGESWWVLPLLLAAKPGEATAREDAVRAQGDASLFLSQRSQLACPPLREVATLTSPHLNSLTLLKEEVEI